MAEITGRFLSVQPSAWKLDIPRHIRHNKLHFWNYDYQGSQANVRCWYSGPLEIWQIHPLASPSSMLLLIGWSVNNFVVAEPWKPAVLASGRKKITDKTNKHLYELFFPGFFFVSCLDVRKIEKCLKNPDISQNFSTGNLCQIRSDCSSKTIPEMRTTRIRNNNTFFNMCTWLTRLRKCFSLRKINNMNTLMTNNILSNGQRRIYTP